MASRTSEARGSAMGRPWARCRAQRPRQGGATPRGGGAPSLSLSMVACVAAGMVNEGGSVIYVVVFVSSDVVTFQFWVYYTTDYVSHDVEKPGHHRWDQR